MPIGTGLDHHICGHDKVLVRVVIVTLLFDTESSTSNIATNIETANTSLKIENIVLKQKYLTENQL